MNFRENFKKHMKKCDRYIADLHKPHASRYVSVEKVQKTLTERQRDLEIKTQQLEIKYREISSKHGYAVLIVTADVDEFEAVSPRIGRHRSRCFYLIY
ncbi:Growth arrest-specific protein 7 [Sciurus carolinensis]|uniref:Growth arrest-specific protein 7 n=1 Tax=Sciurus carolinensis TaxID=30640 RepID=A0AA41N2S0_SCICA|nr:Growth arrest-specific protein 7 [Sciurus carolinensis]